MCDFGCENEKQNIFFELLMKVLLSWLPCFPRRKKTLKQYKSVTSKLLWLLFYSIFEFFRRRGSTWILIVS